MHALLFLGVAVLGGSLFILLVLRDKNSRLVGKVLSMAEYYGDYPCHRVVNHAGRLVPGWLEQRLLLEAEQVVMKDDRHVDLKKCRWDY